MPNPSPDNPGYAGKQNLSSATSQYNLIAFVVQQILGRASTCTLVRIEAVTPPDDPLGPAGTVDVLPLVAQINGAGEATPHVTVFGLPYFRLQGGANAVILDPKPGDIGLAVFADRDISSVKANRGPANPGSLRRYDMADGLYIGGFLNGTPEQYIRFTEGGIEVVATSEIALRAPSILLDGAVHGTGVGTFDGRVTGANIVLDTHTHTSAAPGSPTSPPIP